MKRLIFVTIVCALCCGMTFGQRKSNPKSKPAIDSLAIKGDNWQSVSGASISSNGKYISYLVHNFNKSKKVSDSIHVTDIKCQWKRVYAGMAPGSFSYNSSQYIFKRGDSLHFVMLGENESDRIIPVNYFVINENRKWVVYRQKDSIGHSILLSLETGKETNLGLVNLLSFDPEGTGLILNRIDNQGDTKSQTIDYLTLGISSIRTIWSGEQGAQVDNFSFDNRGQQLVFVSTKNGISQPLHTLWYYKVGEEKAVRKISDDDHRVCPRCQINGTPEFSQNGRWIFFSLLHDVSLIDSIKPKPGNVGVDVWSYRDKVTNDDLTPAALSVRNIKQAVMSTQSDRYQEFASKLLLPPASLPGDLALVLESDSTRWADPRLNFEYPVSYYLYDLNNSSKTFLSKAECRSFSLSPDGLWIIFFNGDFGNWFSYDTRSAKMNNLTGHLPVSFITDVPPDLKNYPVADIAGWCNGNVLIYDNYDIWRIDPTQNSLPLNLSKSFGRIHHIKLRLLHDRPVEYAKGDTLLFTGFNVKNKYNGFIREVVGSKKGPEILYMGPYLFYKKSSQVPQRGYGSTTGQQPEKAPDVNCWLVKRQTASDAPNLFLTMDFKHFQQLTYVKPQIAYNWLTTELVTYKQLDGNLSQGILYKPADFDPSKKYPVIFYYYEQISHRLFEFLNPEWSSGAIDIPWFVSRGYLVFTPDIHYSSPVNKTGISVGMSACNSVVAAAQYLSKRPYVDKRKLGLDGHSFGAYQTNYLITHSHLFRAAAESAGPTDAISNYLELLAATSKPTLVRKGMSQIIAEWGQGRLGATLWQRPDLYLEASIILRASRITAPLLILHNKMDTNVPWSQGVELYMALRRLEKPSWMLQYDHGGHGLNKTEDKIDYTIRLTQFFDHYLKGCPPPVWMTRGIPDSLKGIESGYELDPKGSCSPNCLICKKKHYYAYN